MNFHRLKTARNGRSKIGSGVSGFWTKFILVEPGHRATVFLGHEME